MKTKKENQSIEVKNSMNTPLKKAPVYILKACGFMCALLFCASESNEDRYAVKSAFSAIPVIGGQIGEIAGWVTFLGKAIGMNKLTRNEINEFMENFELHYEFYLLAREKKCDQTKLSFIEFSRAYYSQRKVYQEFLKQGQNIGLKEQNLAHYIYNRLSIDFKNQKTIFCQEILIKLQENKDFLSALQEGKKDIEGLCKKIENNIFYDQDNILTEGLLENLPNKTSIKAFLDSIKKDINKFKEELIVKQRIYQDIKSGFILELVQAAEKERQTFYKNKGSLSSFIFWIKHLFSKDEEIENLKNSLRERLEDSQTAINWPEKYESKLEILANKIEAFQALKDKFPSKLLADSAQIKSDELIEEKNALSSNSNYFLEKNDIESIKLEYRIQWNRYYKKSLRLEKQFQKNDRYFLSKHKEELKNGEIPDQIAKELNKVREEIAVTIDTFYFKQLKEAINNSLSENIHFKSFEHCNLPKHFDDKEEHFQKHFELQKNAFFEKKKEKATNFFEKIRKDFEKDEEEIYEFFRKKHILLQQENDKGFNQVLNLNIAWKNLSDQQKRIILNNLEHKRLKKARQQARLAALEEEYNVCSIEQLQEFTSVQAKNAYLQALRKNREAYLQKLKKLLKPLQFKNAATVLGQILGTLASIADAATAFLNGKTLLAAILLLLSVIGVNVVLNGAIWPVLLVGGFFALSVFFSALFLLRPAAVEVTENGFDKLNSGFKKITPIKLVRSTITVIFATISAVGAGLFVYQFFYLELIPFISQFIIVTSPLALSLGIAIPIAFLAFYEVLTFRGIKLYRAIDYIIKFFQGAKFIDLKSLSTKQKCFIPVVVLFALLSAFASASAAFFGASALMPTPIAVIFAIASFVCVLAVIIPPLKDIFIGKPEKEITYIEDFNEESTMQKLNKIDIEKPPLEIEDHPPLESEDNIIVPQKKELTKTISPNFLSFNKNSSDKSFLKRNIENHTDNVLSNVGS